MKKAGWANPHIQYLKAHYGEKAAQWKAEGADDDRRVFCNIYEMIIEAYESIEGCPDYVKCAVHEKCERDERLMRSIMKRF